MLKRLSVLVLLLTVVPLQAFAGDGGKARDLMWYITTSQVVDAGVIIVPDVAPDAGLVVEVPVVDAGTVVVDLPVTDPAVIFTKTTDGGVNINGAVLPVLPNPDDNLMGVLSLGFDAFKNKNWVLLVALALILLTWVTTKFVGAKVPFFQTPEGKVLTLFLYSFAGALFTAGSAGQPFSLGLIGTALMVALMAAGGFSTFKGLFQQRIWPALKAFFTKKSDPPPPAAPSA